MPKEVWTPQDWEKYTYDLLIEHYGVTDFQKVPDKHCGDFGVEGYTVSGDAFQSYATQDRGISSKERYNRQRDKITADIDKFIKKRDELKDLFGDILIERWMLLVPRFGSSKLTQHASKKTKEVLDHELPYVSDEFQVMVGTHDNFRKAKRKLDEYGLGKVDISVSTLDEQDYSDLREEHVEPKFINNLERKLRKTETINAEDDLDEIKEEFIKWYLQGCYLLGKIESEYPDTYEDIWSILSGYKKGLTLRSKVEADRNSVKQEMEDLKKELESKITGVNPSNVADITNYSISNWLMRCPMDFS